MLHDLQLFEVDLEEVAQVAKIQGNGEGHPNVYQAVLNAARKYQDEGLTPVAMYSPLTNTMVVTSREHLEAKLH